MKNSNLYIFLLFLLVGTSTAYAQTVPVGSPVLDEYMRRMQLLGELSDKTSFNIRPIYPAYAFDKEIGFDLDGSFVDIERSEFHGFLDEKEKVKILALPFTNRFQFNSDYAFGQNNGAMIPNRGMQNVVSAGFFAQYGKLSIQLQPEIIIAQNRAFQGFPIEHQSTILYYYEYLNRIDMPERFGEGAYLGLLGGQSSIRFNHNGVSFGLSTENLWWGPGKRSSLLMSNNAPGFLHFTLNTQKPVETKIGDFEWQLISGFLKSTNFLPPHSDYFFQNNNVYIPKREDGNRYISGLIFSYQPKWVPGLSFGYASVNHMYRADMDRFDDYLPIFNGEKRLSNVFIPARNKRQQFSSGFFRWISTEGHFEFYGEYGTNGNSRRLKDFLITPEKNRGFTFGFSNLMPLKWEKQFIQFSAEMTQTGQTIRQSIHELDTWYIHNHVHHGYTHHGQVLGMGYGPAANVNWAEIAWVKDFNRVAFHFERIVYNNDFYYFRYETSKDWRNKYVDLVPSLIADWRFGNLLVNANLQFVNTLNYKWFLVNHPDQYFVPGLDKNNFVANFGVSYILK